MTYNIRGGLGMDDCRSIGRIAEVVRESAAEVAGLQEVHQRLPQSGFQDQPRALTRATGMKCLFGPVLKFGLGRYGNAVLSRAPARRKQVHPLPGVGESRAALEVELELEGRRLTLFCTHLGLSEAARMKQAAALATAVQRAGSAVVVVGDFNASPGSAEERLLLSAGLDHAAPPLEPTFPSLVARHRIDWVLLSPELICRECRVISSLASDHLPVAADIEWA